MSFAHKKIYLAGPITGESYNVARNGWRRDLSDLFKNRGADHIECYSPMREKEFLEKDQCIGGEADYESLHGFGTPQGILTRDYNDVFTCDAMIANFIGAKRVSIGTCVEFGFAKSHQKPVIMVMEPAQEVVTERKDVKAVIDYNVLADGPEAVAASLKLQGFTDYRVAGDFDSPSNHGHIFALSVPAKVEIVKNIHDHVFLRACAGYVVPTIEHAADIAQSLLTPGT